VRRRFFFDDQSWGLYHKPVCLECYSRKYCDLRLNLEPLQSKPSTCEDCGKPADCTVSVPDLTLVDYEIFPPTKGASNQ
jgi:hypothetical protein